MATAKKSTKNVIDETFELGTTISYLKSLGVVSIIPKVRVSKGDVPYITFSTSTSSEAQVLYVSRGLGDKLELQAGDGIDFVKDSVVKKFIYESGEERIKICAEGESPMVDFDSLF